jgi:hypothetical protein
MPSVIIPCQAATPRTWFLAIGRLTQVRHLGISARTIIRDPQEGVLSACESEPQTLFGRQVNNYHRRLMI